MPVVAQQPVRDMAQPGPGHVIAATELDGHLWGIALIALIVPIPLIPLIALIAPIVPIVFIVPIVPIVLIAFIVPNALCPRHVARGP